MERNQKKQMAAGVVFSYLSVAFKILSGVIYTPIILHSLGQSEYGIYLLCISFIGYLTILNGGMNAAYVRFYVQAREKKTHSSGSINGIINGIFLKIFLVLGIIGMVGGLLVSANAEFLFGSKILPEEYEIFKKSLRVLSVTVLATSLNWVFSSCIIAHEKFVVGKLIDLLHTILVPVVTVPFLLTGFGSVAVVAVNLALTLAMLAANCLYAMIRLHMRFDFGYSDREFLGSVVVFAGFIAIQAVMDQLNWQVDKFILARVSGADSVAVYSVGSTFNSYFLTISSAVSGVFIAEVNRMAARKKDVELSSLFIKTSRIFAQVAVFIMSGFVFFGRPFILRWSGQEYADSYYIGVLIMAPVTVALSQGLGQDIARAKNMHKIQILINVAVAFLNLLVSIPLAKRFGAIGSAWGTFLCEVIICIFVQTIYYQKMVRLDMKAYYKEMLKLLPGWVIPFAAGITVMCFGIVHASYVSVFVYAVLYTVIFGASVWCISLSEREKAYVKGIFCKVENGLGEIIYDK